MVDFYSKIPAVLDINKLQDILKIGRTTAYKLAEDGKMKCFRINRVVQIPKKYFIEYIKHECYNIPVTLDKQSDMKEDESL
jgi:hypothetical protein